MNIQLSASSSIPITTEDVISVKKKIITPPQIPAVESYYTL